MGAGHRKLEQLFGMSAELHQRRVKCMRRRGRRVFLIAGSDKKKSHCGDSRPQNIFSRTRIAVIGYFFIASCDKEISQRPLSSHAFYSALMKFGTHSK